ncbi:MAG: hypothetical protein OXF26_11175 [Alphaproteobacteria bacterium]|nr:hypothetical protein [Alphaproteobacteria bacterium]
MNRAQPPNQGSPFDDFDAPFTRQLVMDGFDRYLTGARERIDPFVDAHFSFSGTLKLHRHAVGRDILRAPANVALAVPQFGLMAGSKLARRTGWKRGAHWMGAQQIAMETAVAREIQWLVHTELLQLPYRQGARASTRDALTEAVFADPRIKNIGRLVFEAIGRHTNDPKYRRNLERKLADYTRSREAATEITSAIISAAAGVIAFNQMTPSVMSLGPAAAAAAAQSAAIAGFPLGTTLGGVWYSMFPASAGVATTVAVTVALALVMVPFCAFAGVVADPAQRYFGVHQRRLGKLIDAIGSDLKGEGSREFEVRDHYVMRVLDFVEVLRLAWRLARG